MLHIGYVIYNAPRKLFSAVFQTKFVWVLSNYSQWDELLAPSPFISAVQVDNFNRKISQTFIREDRSWENGNNVLSSILFPLEVLSVVLLQQCSSQLVRDCSLVHINVCRFTVLPHPTITLSTLSMWTGKKCVIFSHLFQSIQIQIFCESIPSSTQLWCVITMRIKLHHCLHYHIRVHPPCSHEYM